MDLEFIFRPDQEGGPCMSGQSRNLNISCHVRLNDAELKKHGLDYLILLCGKIKNDMESHYENSIIGKS